MSEESVDALLGAIATTEAGPRLGRFVSGEVERIRATATTPATSSPFRNSGAACSSGANDEARTYDAPATG